MKMNIRNTWPVVLVAAVCLTAGWLAFRLTINHRTNALCLREAEKLMVEMRGRGIEETGVYWLGPVDCWGTGLMALYLEKSRQRVARVSSAGRDRQHGTNDDFVRAVVYTDWFGMAGDGIENSSARAGKGFTRGVIEAIAKSKPGA